MRLFMWPTELLWDFVDEAIVSHEMGMKRNGYHMPLKWYVTKFYGKYATLHIVLIETVI